MDILWIQILWLKRHNHCDQQENSNRVHQYLSYEERAELSGTFRIWLRTHRQLTTKHVSPKQLVRREWKCSANKPFHANESARGSQKSPSKPMLSKIPRISAAVGRRETSSMRVPYHVR